MIDQQDIKKIKESTETFFQKMTISLFKIEAGLSLRELNYKESVQVDKDHQDVINLDINLEEPQILIGEKGQTLFEIQRLLKMILNKNLQKIFYLNLDINDYKKKKIEYLKSLAKDLADEVSFSKEEKILLPMSSYERRIIHTELSQRHDITTESQGEGFDRHIVIKPN
jgi:spoIIIJ-associated protein